MSKDSGNICIDGGVLRYRSKTYGCWHLHVADIRLVGEYTNQSGPALDDWFYVFLLHEDCSEYIASAYASGIRECITELAKALPSLTPSQLSNSSNFASNVLWPERHAGKPFYEFAAMQRGPGVLNRVLDKMFPPFVLNATLKDEFRA